MGVIGFALYCVILSPIAIICTYLAKKYRWFGDLLEGEQ